MERNTWREFIKNLAVIAIPIAVQNLLTTTASMVDTMMVAPLGELSVGALGLCAQFSSLMFSGYWGFVGGGMLFFSQYYGAKEDKGIERSYGLTWACMMTVAAVFGCLAIFAPATVMKIYTDKSAIQEIGVQYLRIVGFAYFLQVFSMAMSSLLRATERVKIPMIASIASVSSNLFLNWVFIYGHLGAPAMGIRGAALATTCVALVNVMTIYLLAWKAGYPYLFHVRGHFRWTGGAVREYFTKCFPILCNEILIGVGNMVINITLGRQSEQVIAALAVFRTLEGLIIGFFAGFSNASSVLVGTCVGAGELDKAYERAKRLVYLCSGVIGAVNLILLAVHAPILHGMSLEGESYRAGTLLLLMFAVISVIRMGNWIQNDTYRASGDAVYGTVLEIVFMYAMVLPCVLLSGFLLKLPYWAVFLCCYIDEPIRYLLMQIHLYSGRWIKPVTEPGKAALAEFRAKHGVKGRKTGKIPKKVTLALMTLILLVFAIDAITSPDPLAKGYLIYGDDWGLLTEYGRLVHVSKMGCQFWRLVTVMFLHAGLPHLFVNLLALYTAGGILEKKLGGAKFLMVFLVTGILSSVVNMLFTDGAVGASGGIYGVVACIFLSGSFHVREKYGVLKLIVLLLYLTLPNLSANTALIAHGTGLVAGALIGFVAFRRKDSGD